MEQLIHKWIFSLITNKPDYSLIDKETFHLEDGMTLDEYISYELSQFKNLSHLFDLTNDFNIKIAHKTFLKDNVFTYHFLILNSQDKIVCKMHITINDSTLKITSNNHWEQIVPKFGILNDKPTEIGFAIKTPLNLLKAFSPDLEIIDFFPGDNFENDQFYSLKLHHQDIYNSEIKLHLVYKENNKIVTKTRNIFLDVIDYSLKPFKIEDNILCIIDSMYPVGASFHFKDGGKKAIEYPRNFSINLNNVKFLTITDSIDNDWHLGVNT